MPIFFFIYCYIMRILPEKINSIDLYWLMQSILFLIMSIYIFNNSKKNVINLFLCIGLCILFVKQIVDRTFLLLGYEINDYLYIPLLSAILITSHISIFRNRYKWEKMKGNNYDRNKIQRIYSKPTIFLTLLGAATSLSPKCSVRYTYNDKTIRFKRGSKTPVICNTVIKKTDIIEDTNLTVDYFDRRWEEIKDKKYNLLTFNCRRLF